MKQVFSGRVLAGLLFALSFVVVRAYVCLPAEAQSNQEKSNGAAKDFEFEVVSLRPSGVPNGGGGTGMTPDGFRVTINLGDMIKLAYTPMTVQHGPLSDPTKVINLPTWGFWYQIDARVAAKDMPAWQAQGKDQALLRSAMRALLKERFRLVLHEQHTPIAVYNLVVSRRGMKLKSSAPGAVLPPGFKFPDGGVSSLFTRDPNQPAAFYNATMADLIWVMEQDVRRPIQDATGLIGRYDFSVYRQHVEDPDMSYEYLLGKVGLELKPSKGMGTDLVVDHIEKPSPN